MSEHSALQSSNEDAALVLRQFRIVFNAIRTHFRQVEKESGLGGAQVWALSLISAQPGLGVGEVAMGMDTHQSTASNLIKTLASKRLILLNRSAVDKRIVQLQITSAGQAILDKIQGPFEGVLPQALNCLETSTLTNLKRDLGILIRILKADDHAANIPLANL